MVRVFAIGIISLFLYGCSMGTSSLLMVEREEYHHGRIIRERKPDQTVTGAIIGGGVSVITGKPWGILAGASVQISEKIADAIKKGGHQK